MTFRPNRRQVVRTAFTAGGALLLTNCKTSNPSGSRLRADGDAAPAATTARLRSDAHTAEGTAMLALYAQAVGIMKTKPETSPWNWNFQATIHNNFCPHNNWFFFPWHRAYLHHFERIIEAVLIEAGAIGTGKTVTNFALPYWDWSKTATMPAAFTAPAAATNHLYDDTRFPGWVLNPNNVGATRVRELLASSDFHVIAGARTTAKTTTLEEQQDWLAGGSIEGTPHNHVHGAVGRPKPGSSEPGNMGAFMSPLDPIFWLHHCNIDRLWEAWRVRLISVRAASAAAAALGGPLAAAALLSIRSEEPPNAADATHWKGFQLQQFWPPNAADNTAANAVKPTVESVFDMSTLGYGYDRLTVEAPPPPKPAEPAIAPATADLEVLKKAVSLNGSSAAKNNGTNISFGVDSRFAGLLTAFSGNFDCDRLLGNENGLALQDGGNGYDPTFRLTLREVRVPPAGVSFDVSLKMGEKTQPVGNIAFFGQGGAGVSSHHSHTTSSFIYDLKIALDRLFTDAIKGTTLEVILTAVGGTADAGSPTATLEYLP